MKRQTILKIFSILALILIVVGGLGWAVTLIRADWYTSLMPDLLLAGLGLGFVTLGLRSRFKEQDQEKLEEDQ